MLLFTFHEIFLTTIEDKLSMIDIDTLKLLLASTIMPCSLTLHESLGSDELIGFVTIFIGSNLVLFRKKSRI